jgi:hypothetical protein
MIYIYIFFRLFVGRRKFIAYQLLAHGRWFPPGNPASTTKTGRHDIAEILLKVVLKQK